MAQLRPALLKALANGKHLTANELAAEVGSTWHAVYPELKRLEKAGKVRKEPIRWFLYESKAEPQAGAE